MRAAYWAAYQAELERLDARQCKTGYGCGSSCISLAKDCQKTPKAATGKERLRRISQLAGGEIGEGKGLGRLRQTEAAAKLEELQGERQTLAKAKRVVREIRQRRNQEATQQQTVRTPDRDRDTAVANIPMSGKRGRDLDREIERNVRAQKAEKQAADRERGRQLREAQKQALELRKQHEKEFINELAQKMDKPRKEVQGAFRSLTYQQQVQVIEKWVKEKGEQPTTQEPKQPGRQPAAQPKLNEQQRNRMEYINQQNGRFAADMRRASMEARSLLPTKRTKEIGVRTAGGELIQIVEKDKQKWRTQPLGREAQLRIRELDPDGRLVVLRDLGDGQLRALYAFPGAKTMMELGEKALARRFPIKRRKPRTDSIYQSAYKSELLTLRLRNAA